MAARGLPLCLDMKIASLLLRCVGVAHRGSAEATLVRVAVEVKVPLNGCTTIWCSITPSRFHFI